VVRLIGAGLDVTEMKRVEAQLRQSQKMEAIGLLAGGVAHDFNNLLTIVSGVAEVLRGELAANPSQAAMVEELLTAARRGSDLTRQLMAFGRRTIVEPRVFELAEGVRQSAPLVRRLLGDRVELVLDLPDGLGLVRMDPGGLDQVLFNLASNARDAMPDGGVLAIRADRVTLDAAAAERAALPVGTYLQLEVADTGTGMTPEVQQRVFEPFFTTKATGQGTGLGLATVFGIVAQSGGSIRLRSLVGTGTTFTILFPAVEAAARRISRPDSMGAELPRGGERILVAEDEDGVRKLVCRLLKGLGYQVLEASRGRQALALAEAADRIDLLLTDVRMPDLSGPELADLLQAARPGLRVLFMSGYIDDPELRQQLASGSAAVLDKPFTTQQLAERVRAVLEPAAPSA
jgi:nitrogen-specific signal transduction histidine kinase/CheY-like chemotaxis protein